jgi:hypothetical protein
MRACMDAPVRKVFSPARTVGTSCMLALLAAGCALPGKGGDPAKPVARIAREPSVAVIETSGARRYEPATDEADVRLEAELAALFAGVADVERAYLTRARRDEGGDGGVLTVCIVARAPVSDDVVRRIGRAFATTHGTAGMLDVQEIGAAQERTLAASVRPFYGSSPPPKETAP